MSRSLQACAITTPFLALATIVLFLRLYTRLFILKNAGVEDYLVVVAWIFAFILDALFLHEISIGTLNKHYQEMLATMSPQSITAFRKRFFVSIFIYILSLTFAKLSVALQYRRIFTGGKTKQALWLTIFLIITTATWSLSTNLFFCTPIRKSWDPSTQGSCLNKRKAWFSYSGANIFLSSLLMLLPIPAISKLQMQWRTKIALLGIFSLGIFDIILACLRLSSLSNLATTTDISWELQPLGIWTNLESSVAIICASLPALRPLVAKAFPGFFSTLSDQSTYALPSRERWSTRIDFSRNRDEGDFVRMESPGQTGDVESGEFGMGRGEKDGVVVGESIGAVELGADSPYTSREIKAFGTFSSPLKEL